MFAFALRTRKEHGQNRRLLRQLRLELLEDRSLMAAVAGGIDKQPLVDAGSGSAGYVASAGLKKTSTSAVQAAALTDDSYEQNDTLATARNLGTLTASTTISNLVMADSADWYRFTTTKTGTTSDNVSISFLHSQGDLDLELYNTAGTRLRVSNGVTNSETVTLNGLAAGNYYIRVFGYRGVTNPNYSLTINPPRTIVDDAYEQNDTRATARDLGTLTTTTTISNLVMADSHDWYRFTMSGSGSTADYVSISSTIAQGDLDLELYDSGGTRVSVSQSSTNNEQISLSGRAGGTYYVHVLGYNGSTNSNYTLEISPGTGTPLPPPPSPPPNTGSFDIQFAFSGLTAGQRAIFDQAALKWESIIVGDLPSATYNGVAVDDLLIDASGTPIDGTGNILGQAGPDRYRAGSSLPYHGVMEFDTADLASMEANGTLLGVIEHEMGHVLGIGTIWSTKGLLVGASTFNPRFTGAQASAEYFALSGISGGVPVENTGGSGTRNSHWRESTFGNELMTGWVGPGSSMPISRVTVASLADLGYTVNIAAADPYSLPASSRALVTSSMTTTTASNSIRLGELHVTPILPITPHTNQRPTIVPASSTGQDHRSDQAVAGLTHRPHVEAVDEVLTSWSSHSSDLVDFEITII
jgi:hypothetical protein